MRSLPEGFTIVELIVSLGIFGLMLVIGIPSYANLRQNVALGNEADEIVGLLRLAQSNAMASQDGLSQGVYFTASSYCLFSGASWTSCQPTTTYSLGRYGITINTSGGTPITTPISVVFQRLSGVTSAQTIYLGTSGGTQKVIQLEVTGKISLQ